VRYNPAIPIESFDLIIADECHRSIYDWCRRIRRTSRPPRCSSGCVTLIQAMERGGQGRERLRMFLTRHCPV
jgi:type I site-specific restriction endonuclease